MDNLQRPNKGDRILAEWARKVVEALRKSALVSSEDFEVKETAKGTVVSFRTKKKKRYKVKIKLAGGAISRAYTGLAYENIPSVSMDVPVKIMIHPLGEIPTTEDYDEYKAKSLMAGELVDGGPYEMGQGLLGFNATTIVETEIVEEE